MTQPSSPLGSTPPKRILLVRLSHLGDACHALAVYHALVRSQPQAQLWWAIQPEFAGLLDNLPGLEGTLTFERRGGWQAWPRLRRKARLHRFDWAVDAQGNWKSALVARFSGAPIRLGLAKIDWREPSAARWMTHLAAPAQGVHALHRMQALAEAVGDRGPLSWHLPLSEAERRAGRMKLRECFPEADQGGARILHLAAPSDPRSWPGDHFLTLAKQLAHKGSPVLLLSGPAEARIGAELQARAMETPGIRHLVGQRGLRDLAALFCAASEQGVRLLACDSGPSHVAASVGLAVDLLAGPTDPQRTGPWPLGGVDPGHRVWWDPNVRDLKDLEPARVWKWLEAEPRGPA